MGPMKRKTGGSTNDGVDAYLEALDRLQTSLADGTSDLPRRCRELASRFRTVSPDGLTKNWPRIYSQLCSCSVALNPRGIVDPEEIESRRKSVQEADFGSTSVFGSIAEMVLSPLAGAAAILSGGLFGNRNGDDEGEACLCQHVESFDDVPSAEALEDLRLAQRSFEESQKSLVAANREVDASPETPSLVKQQAFVRFNESLTKVVMEMSVTMKIGDRDPVTLKSPLMSFDLPPEAKVGKPVLGVVEPPRLGVNQLQNHKAICARIVEALEQCRVRQLANVRGELPVKEPKVPELMKLINRNAGDESGEKINIAKVRRHLESALGYKLDYIKQVTRHGGVRDPQDNTERGRQIRAQFLDYKDVEICLYWAALSRQNEWFVRAARQEIRRFATKMESKIYSYRRAVEIVDGWWREGGPCEKAQRFFKEMD